VFPFLKIGHTIAVFQSLGICSLTYILLINFCIYIARCASLRSSELMSSSPGDLLFFRELMIILISSRFGSSISSYTVSYSICSYLSPNLGSYELFSSCSKCSLKRFYHIVFIKNCNVALQSFSSTTKKSLVDIRNLFVCLTGLSGVVNTVNEGIAPVRTLTANN